MSFIEHEINRAFKAFERDPVSFLAKHPMGDIVHNILFGTPLKFPVADREQNAYNKAYVNLRYHDTPYEARASRQYKYKRSRYKHSNYSRGRRYYKSKSFRYSG